MKKQRSSRSAMGVALIRAVESKRPESQRICYDPYARAMVPAVTYALTAPIVGSWVYDRLAPGATTFIALRERYIDDLLVAALGEGVEQVVLLGAGFDTRAYRVAGIAKARVFEVDHPATQATKRARLKKVIDPLPGHVTFVPVDFETDRLGDSLARAGYDEGRRTFFIWQGVTYFLTRASVDATLAFVAGHAGRGSSIVFDYFYSEVFRDTARADVKALQRAARISGEAYLFGIDEGKVEPFLTTRGFRDVRNATFEELKRRYLTRANASRTVPAGMSIAIASV